MIGETNELLNEATTVLEPEAPENLVYEPAPVGPSNNGKVYQRPDIVVRNQMMKELGRMPTKEEVRIRMGLDPNKPVPANIKGKGKIGKKKRIKFVRYEELGPNYITLKEAQKLTGLAASVLYHRVLRGTLDGLKTSKDGQSAVFYVVNKEAALALNKRGATKPETVSRAKARAALEMAKAPVETVDHSLQNHISYAYGHCRAWLEVYAAGCELPVSALATPVGELLRKGKS